jgi:hypothetical protein
MKKTPFAFLADGVLFCSFTLSYFSLFSIPANALTFLLSKRRAERQTQARFLARDYKQADCTELERHQKAERGSPKRKNN